MPNIRLIKRRIRSIRNTAKITKAMQLVAASKMRRAQERALQGRPYDQKLRQVIANLMAAHCRDRGEDLHPLLSRRKVNRIGIIHITADRGLCGGLNSNVNRRSASLVLERGVSVEFVAVGRKGRDFLLRTGQKMVAEFTRLGDKPKVTDIQPIARIAVDDYLKGQVDEVNIVYPQFVTTTTQRPVVQRLLPVEPAIFPAKQNVDYIFEPEPGFVLDHLLPRFAEMEIYHAILETIASEQSARMVAMKSATDNAGEIVEELTLEHNKARQEMITKELLDLMGAAAAGQGR